VLFGCCPDQDNAACSAGSGECKTSSLDGQAAEQQLVTKSVCLDHQQSGASPNLLLHACVTCCDEHTLYTAIRAAGATPDKLPAMNP